MKDIQTPVGCTVLATCWSNMEKEGPSSRVSHLCCNIRPFDSTTCLGILCNFFLLFFSWCRTIEQPATCGTDVAGMGCCSSSSSDSFCKGRIFKMSCRVVPHTWKTIGSPESGFLVFSCGLQCSCPFLRRFKKKHHPF